MGISSSIVLAVVPPVEGLLDSALGVKEGCLVAAGVVAVAVGDSVVIVIGGASDRITMGGADGVAVAEGSAAWVVAGVAPHPESNRARAASQATAALFSFRKLRRPHHGRACANNPGHHCKSVRHPPP